MRAERIILKHGNIPVFIAIKLDVFFSCHTFKVLVLRVYGALYDINLYCTAMKDLASHFPALFQIMNGS